MVGVQDWLLLRGEVITLAGELRMKIKFERKFVDRRLEDLRTDCVIIEEKDGNIMVFPDERVYRCALFFNSKGMNSLRWDGAQMLETAGLNEQLICSLTGDCDGCAGTALLNNQAGITAGEDNYKTICMYKKEVL